MGISGPIDLANCQAQRATHRDSRVDRRCRIHRYMPGRSCVSLRSSLTSWLNPPEATDHGNHLNVGGRKRLTASRTVKWKNRLAHARQGFFDPSQRLSELDIAGGQQASLMGGLATGDLPSRPADRRTWRNVLRRPRDSKVSSNLRPCSRLIRFPGWPLHFFRGAG